MLRQVYSLVPMSINGPIDQRIMRKIGGIRTKEKGGGAKLRAALLAANLIFAAPQAEAGNNTPQELTFKGNNINPDNDSILSSETNSLMEEFQAANERVAKLYMKIALMWDEKSLRELQTNHPCLAGDIKQFKELKEGISDDMSNAFKIASQAQNLSEGQEKEALAANMYYKIDHARGLLVQLAKINMRMAATAEGVLSCAQEGTI